MHRSGYLLLSAALLAGAAVTHSQTAADQAVYDVSYVEIMPSARSPMVAAMKAYRDASRKEDGYGRFDLLEQVGWAGRFVVVEVWRDRSAFDAHAAAPHTKRFKDALEPIRVSGYDERPYKSFSTAALTADEGGASHVVAHVDIGPGGQAEAPAMLRGLAEASRKERGNLRFDVLQHAMRANHYTIVETWRSRQARDAHAASAHARQYRDKLQPISGSPLDERLYQSVE